MMIRWIGEKLGLLEPPDEETEAVRATALKTAHEAHDEVNRSRRMRGVASVEFDVLRRGHQEHQRHRAAH